RHHRLSDVREDGRPPDLQLGSHAGRSPEGKQFAITLTYAVKVRYGLYACGRGGDARTTQRRHNLHFFLHLAEACLALRVVIRHPGGEPDRIDRLYATIVE